MKVQAVSRLVYLDRSMIKNSHEISMDRVQELIHTNEADMQNSKISQYHIEDSVSISDEAKDEAEQDNQKKILFKNEELANVNAFKVNKIESILKKLGIDDDTFAFNKDKNFETKQLEKLEKSSFANLKDYTDLKNDEAFEIFKRQKFVQKQGYFDNKDVFAFNKEQNFETQQLDKLENASFSNLKDYTDLKNDEAFEVFERQKFVQKQGYFDDRSIFAFNKEQNFETQQLDELENASYDNLIDYTDVANDEVFDVIKKDKFVEKAGYIDDKSIFEFNKKPTYEEETLKKIYTDTFKDKIDYTDVKNDEAFDIFEKQKFVQKAGKIDNDSVFEFNPKPKSETNELNEVLKMSFSNEKNIHDLAEDDTFVVIEDGNKPQKEGSLDDRNIFAFNPKLKSETTELNEVLNMSFSNEKNMHDLAEDDTFIVIKDSNKLQKEGTLDDRSIFAFNPKLKSETNELNKMLNMSFSNEKNMHDLAEDETFVVIQDSNKPQKEGNLDNKQIFNIFDKQKDELKQIQEKIALKKQYDDKEYQKNISTEKMLKQIEEQKLYVDLQNKEKTLQSIDDKEDVKADGKLDDDEIFNDKNKVSYEKQAEIKDTQTDKIDVKNNLNTQELVKKVDDYLKELSGIDCERCMYLESIGFYDSPQRAELILLQAISTANMPMIGRINQLVSSSSLKKRK